MNNTYSVKNNFHLFLATTIGNIFEMFDFFVFVFLSSILATLFFPPTIGSLSLVFTYLTITISYLLRPIGGIILGSFGDRYGRKSVFTLSILCTAIPSLVIGLLPTFDKIGYLATIILVISRIFQGFSSGAELPGAITFIAEKYSQKNYYYYCAWISFGANLSIASGSLLIRVMTNSMSHDFLYSYGWRIPFLSGGLLAVIGFYIRKHIAETEQFQALKQQNKLQKIPVFSLFANHKTAIVLGAFLALIVLLITSIFHLFLPNLFIKYLHLSLQDSAGVSATGAITLAIFILVFAIATYKFNPIRIAQLSIIGLIITFSLVLNKYIILNNLHNLYTVVIVVSILLAGVNGIYAGLLVDLFPTEVRYSGVAVCFTIAATLGAGLTPLWTSAILTLTHSYMYIILVCLTICIVSLINLYYLKKYLSKKDYDPEYTADLSLQVVRNHQKSIS
ncbi:MAG TPA: MFS transporter [Aquella sp.]|nr:MFS transporter [Aquella sp.]